MQYWMHTPEGAVGAGVGQAPEGPGHATFYVAVDDPQAALDKVEQLGGQTVVPVTEMEMVTFALFTDPEGHLVGIVKNQ
jgi:predicted enzyme related to lactoylglutathione lyase